MFFPRRRAEGPLDWLLVGLGNPGRQYEQTRHNVGFLVMDELAARQQIPLTRLKHRALTGRADFRVPGGQDLRALLMKPTTYMNLSGESVREAAKFYHIPPERILIVFDDVDLPAGKLRIRRKGSAGGHNGLKSLIYHLRSEDFPRIKIGVGQKPHPDYDMADWVLSRFSAQEQPLIAESVKEAADAAVLLITQSIEAAMERYNGS